MKLLNTSDMPTLGLSQIRNTVLTRLLNVLATLPNFGFDINRLTYNDSQRDVIDFEVVGIDGRSCKIIIFKRPVYGPDKRLVDDINFTFLLGNRLVSSGYFDTREPCDVSTVVTSRYLWYRNSEQRS